MTTKGERSRHVTVAVGLTAMAALTGCGTTGSSTHPCTMTPAEHRAEAAEHDREARVVAPKYGRKHSEVARAHARAGEEREHMDEEECR